MWCYIFLRILGYFARNISLKQLKNWTWIIIIKDHFVPFSLWFHEQFSILLRRFSSHFISYSRHKLLLWNFNKSCLFLETNTSLLLVGKSKFLHLHLCFEWIWRGNTDKDKCKQSNFFLWTNEQKKNLCDTYSYHLSMSLHFRWRA